MFMYELGNGVWWQEIRGGHFLMMLLVVIRLCVFCVYIDLMLA